MDFLDLVMAWRCCDAANDVIATWVENGMSEEEYDDSTAVVVMKVRSKTRAKKVRVLLVALLAIAAFYAFVRVFDVDKTENKTAAWMHGKKYVDKGEIPISHPEWSVARVHISISSSAPLTVDGRKIGPAEHHTVDFEPGDHTIDVQVNGAIMRQMMRVRAGEEHMIYFDLREKKIERSFTDAKK